MSEEQNQSTETKELVESVNKVLEKDSVSSIVLKSDKERGEQIIEVDDGVMRPKGYTDDDILVKFESLRQVAIKVIPQLTTRQASRVFISLINAPFHAPKTFASNQEKKVYNLLMECMDAKMAAIGMILRDSEKKLQKSAENTTELSKEESTEVSVEGKE